MVASRARRRLRVRSGPPRHALRVSFGPEADTEIGPFADDRLHSIMVRGRSAGMTDNHSTAQQSPSLGLELLVAGATMVGCGEAPANTRKTKASTGIG